MNLSYLLIDLGAISIPLLFSFHKKLRFVDHWSAFAKACLLVLIPFVVWDILFTKWEIWGFTDQYLVGINIFNLPVEELLFFVCIPFACVFTWHCFQVLLSEVTWKKVSLDMSPVLVLVLIIVAAFNIDKAYTSTTFFFLAFVLILLRYVWQLQWLGRFYFTYLILLLPFFVVNGMLTGTGFDPPIVWYDNTENLSIRLLTIPVEDIFYGMLLILMNVGLYQYFVDQKRLSE